MPTVPENACLDDVFKVMQRAAARASSAWSIRSQRLLGYITAENLAELVMIRSAQGTPPGQAATTPA